MKREDVVAAYKILVEMNGLADKLEEAVKKEEDNKANELKKRLLELQRGLKNIL